MAPALPRNCKQGILPRAPTRLQATSMMDETEQLSAPSRFRFKLCEFRQEVANWNPDSHCIASTFRRPGRAWRIPQAAWWKARSKSC